MESELKTLEGRLRNAKPDTPELPPHFALEVMEAIEREGVSIRPVWRGLLLLWGRRAAGVAGLLVAAALVNAAVYDLRVNGGLELVFFGGRFMNAFLAALPWDLMLGALAAGLAAGFLLRIGKTARVRMAWVIIVSYAISLGGGTALAGTGVNQAFHDLVEEGQSLPGPLHWFYATRARYRRPHPGFRIGRVISVKNGTAMLETPLGEKIAVTLPPGFRTAKGQHLRMAGETVRDGFVAGLAMRCGEDQVRPYFHHARMMRRGGMRGPGMGQGMGNPEMRKRMRQMMPGGKGMMRDGMMKGGGMIPGGEMEETRPPRENGTKSEKKNRALK